MGQANLLSSEDMSVNQTNMAPLFNKKKLNKHTYIHDKNQML